MKTKTLVATSLLFALATFSAQARTLTVSSETKTSVSLAFGEPDGRTYTLVYAYGAVDGGTNPAAWESSEVVGEIAADATTLDWTKPEGAYRYGRFFLVDYDASKLPAKFLTYVKSSVRTVSNTKYGPWVDTGVKGKTDLRATFDVAINGAADDDIMGSRHDAGSVQTRFFLGHISTFKVNNKEYNGLSQQLGAWVSPSLVSQSFGSLNTRMAFESEIAVGTRTLWKVNADGTKTEMQKNTGVGVTDTGLNMYLFCANVDGTAKQFSSITLYGTKIWLDGELQRNFIPAQDENGNVGLYDAVSRTFFPNGSTTDKLAAGAEVTDEPWCVMPVAGSASVANPCCPTILLDETAASVTLTAGGINGKTHAIVVAYGETDVGSEYADWDSLEVVGDVTADAPTLVWEKPGSCPKVARFFLLEKPIAKFLTSVKSDPAADATTATAQWIDTGVSCRTGVQATFDILIPDDFVNDRTVMGARADTGDTRFFLGHMGVVSGDTAASGRKTVYISQQYGKFVNPESTSYTDAQKVFVKLDTNKRVEIDSEVGPVGGSRTLKTTDGSKSDTATVTENLDTNLNLYLFAANMYGTAGQFSSFTLYGAKIWLDGELKREYVPAQDANGVGGLYDTVSREFFPSRGKAFVKGEVREIDAKEMFELCPVVTSIPKTLEWPADVVTKAVWTGKGAAGNVMDPANWDCQNAMGGKVEGGTPGPGVSVTIPDGAVFNCPTGTAFTCTEVILPATIGGDCDWSGLDMPLVGTVDLLGHRLTVSRLESAITVTGSSEDATGELVVDVPANVTRYIARTTISGNVKVVKEGAGNLGFEKANQTFTGGVEVKGGKIIPTDNQGILGPAKWVFGGYPTANASATTITLHEGATLDLNGYSNWSYTTVILDGGTVSGYTTSFNARTRLTASSYLKTVYNGSTNFTLPSDADFDDLNGQTLMVDIASGKNLYLNLPSLSNGSIDVRSGGSFTVRVALDARTVNLEMGAALNLHAALSVSNYVAKYTQNSNSGTAALNVYGTFTPKTDYFYGCTLQDGATIDLSERADAWSTTGRFTDGSKTVAFADGATVFVDLGTRTVRSREKIIDWTDHTPANLGTLKFKLVSGQSGALRAHADGLYHERGCIVIIR